MFKAVRFLAMLLIFSACSGDEAVEEPIVETEFAFVGNWLGTWSDNLFQSIQISTKVRKTGTDEYLGDFYINNNGNAAYTAGYGGNTDGQITFETKGDSVLNFVYLQNAPEYMGGCPGTYEGSGVIRRDLNRLIINFTGNDCDGFHDDGEMIFRFDD